MPISSPWPAGWRETLSLFTQFEGPIGRAPFWLGSIAVAVALGVAEALLRRVTGGAVTGAMLVLTGLAILPLGALAARRSLDRGRSAFWGVTLVLFVIGAGLIAGLAAHPAGRLLEPLANGMRLASGLAWAVLLVDLGLMPGRAAPPALDRRIAGRHNPPA